MREGVAVARCTVERLMRRLSLQGVRRGKGVRTTVCNEFEVDEARYTHAIKNVVGPLIAAGSVSAGKPAGEGARVNMPFAIAMSGCSIFLCGHLAAGGCDPRGLCAYGAELRRQNEERILPSAPFILRSTKLRWRGGGAAVRDALSGWAARPRLQRRFSREGQLTSTDRANPPPRQPAGLRRLNRRSSPCLSTARRTVQPQEAVGQDAAFEDGMERILDAGRAGPRDAGNQVPGARSLQQKQEAPCIEEERRIVRDR